MELRVGRLTSARLDFVACDVINWWVILGEGCRSLAIAGREGCVRGRREGGDYQRERLVEGGRHVARSDSLTAWADERMNEWVSEWVSDVCYLTDVGVDNVSLSVHVYMSSCVCEWVCAEKSSSRSRRQLDQSKQSPWKTSECNFQSIVVAALQQHTPAHTHTHAHTHAGILNFC